MDPLQEEIQAGLNQAFKGSPVDTTGMGFENVIKESIVETKPVESTPPAEPTNTLTDNKPEPVDTGADTTGSATGAAGCIPIASWNEKVVGERTDFGSSVGSDSPMLSASSSV